MSGDDWRRVIDEAKTLGVTMVQFIGGEPTLHPGFSDLVVCALGRGLLVEIFTKRRGSYAKTNMNILEALRRSIPLRVGVIDMQDGQRVTEAVSWLKSVGVTKIATDRLRHVGRGVRDQPSDISQLCGACGRGKVAVAGNGDVWPCVFSRWMPVGNVRSATLKEVLGGPEMETAIVRISSTFPRMGKCDPAKSDCQPHCPSGYHSDPKKCWPYYYSDDDDGDDDDT